MRKIYIAIPSHSGDVKVGTMMSVIQTVSDLTSLGIPVNVMCWAGDSLLPHARNILIAQFMATDCTDMVWIDGDMVWDNDAIMRLLSHEADFVAGVYRFKTDKEGYPFRPLPGAQEVTIINPITGEPSGNGVIEVETVPMGFAKITRQALERLCEAHKDKTYTHASAPGYTCHLLFDLEFREGQYWGEDYVFCRKWRDIGGKIYVDPDIKLGHIGQKTFQGDFDKWLLNRNKPEEKMIPVSQVRKVFSHPDYDEMLRVINAIESF